MILNKTKIVLVFCTLLFTSNIFAGNTRKKTEKKDSLTFTVIKENPITSVKNQNRSGTCWDFSTLSFFESELLRTKHKTYDLCEAFVAFKTYMDRAKASVRLHGDISFSQGGSFYDVLYCIKNYGICPEDAMPKPGSLYDDSLFNNNELSQVTTAYVGAIAKSEAKKLTPVWQNGLKGIYEAYLGKLPETFTYEEQTYTPQTFEKSLGLNLDDYVCLTSFIHHPYYTSFPMEVQDNWRWAESYNLPLDEFMHTMDYAIRQGYTFAWGADVTETSFGHNDVILMPAKVKDNDKTGLDQARWVTSSTNDKKEIEVATKNEVNVTPELRQKAYDNWETTDDHGMQIFGLAKDQYGKEYFMMKNSWGDYNKYHGKCYVSKAYVAYKTMNIMINKHAIPQDIAKKLGLD